MATFFFWGGGGCCSLGWPCVLFVFWLFVILLISRFGFKGWVWIQVASVPDLCVLFTFNDFFYRIEYVHLEKGFRHRSRFDLSDLKLTEQSFNVLDHFANH